MRRILLWGLGASFAISSVALAQERPRYIPTRDVTVDYAVTSGQPGVPPSIVVHITAAGQMRVDGGDQGYVLYDTATARTRWVLPRAKMIIELPTRASVSDFIPDADAHFFRAGKSEVAGLECTQWRVTARRGSGDACVTADGVVLRGAGADNHGRAGSIEATSVSYEPQPAGLFETPRGFQRLSLPNGPLVVPPGMH